MNKGIPCWVCTFGRIKRRSRGKPYAAEVEQEWAALKPYRKFCEENFVGHYLWHFGPGHYDQLLGEVFADLYLFCDEDEDMVLFKLKFNSPNWEKTRRYK